MNIENIITTLESDYQITLNPNFSPENGCSDAECECNEAARIEVENQIHKQMGIVVSFIESTQRYFASYEKGPGFGIGPTKWDAVQSLETSALRKAA